MKFKFLILLILLYSFSFGQNDIKVVDFLKSECDNTYDLERIQPRLLEQNYNNSLFTIKIGTVANCLGISLVKADYNNDTLNISYRNGIVTPDTITGGEILEFANCDCCFEFHFFIEGLPKEPNYIIINNREFHYYPDIYKTYAVKFEVYKSDTVNLTDKYGFKQGKWNRIKDQDDMRYEYFTTYDSVYYDAYFINDTAIRYILEAFYPNGQLAVSETSNGFRNIKEERYNENGNLMFQKTGNGFKLGTVRTKFYENGGIKSIEVIRMYFSETLIYYENGKLKEIKNHLIRKKFYPNGKLKMESFNLPAKDNTSSKYYYDNGNIMAVKYIERTKDGFYIKKRWEEYFDINGKKVTEDYLIKKGFKEILDIRY